MMNRSILKTRNQLQRITYKINQLKNKYTGENGAISMPKDSPLRQKPSSNIKRQQSGIRSHRTSIHEVDEDLYHKQLKILKKEIYHYIDKCMLLNNKETKVEKKSNIMDQRLKRIEEELSECIHTNTQILKKIKNPEESRNLVENQKLDELSEKFDLLLGKIEYLGHNENKYDELDTRLTRIQELYEQNSQSIQLQGKIQQIKEKISHIKDNESNIQQKLLQKSIEIKQNLLLEFNIKFQQQFTNFKDLILNERQSLVKAPANEENILENIDEKLDQFQKDINQAIKQLYNDIQSRLSANNEQLRGEIKGNSQKNTEGEFQKHMEKLSCLFERTVEEMQTKMGKLDHNFSYIYERMSNIEYDNMNFKDKLTTYMKMPLTPKNSKENILDTLGQFGSRPTFFSDLE